MTVAVRLAVCLALLWSVPTIALPQAPAPATAPQGSERLVRGWLLRIDGAEYVIDLGSSDGLAPGAMVRLYRTIRAKHPLTGKEVLDRFPVGVAEAHEVASHLSILQPDEATRKTLQVGDMVEFTAKRATPPKPVEAAQPPHCRPCPACPAALPNPPTADRSADDVALDETFLMTLGRVPQERIELWREFVKLHPNSPIVPSVLKEIDALNEMARGSRIAREDAGIAAARVQTAARRVIHLPLDGVDHDLRIGEPAWLVFSAADWSDVTDLRVHYRKVGTGTFQMARPEPSGKLHRRLRLPQELVTTTGFDYFAVLARSDGSTADIAGSVKAPTRVTVTDPYGQVGKAPVDATILRFMGEFVDFNRFRRDDQVGYGEMSVSYRLQESEYLYAFEMGYGMFNGGGGKVAGSDLTNSDGTPRLQASGPAMGEPILKDDTIDPHPSSFKYAYLSTEWAFTPIFHLLTRAVVGLERGGLDSGLELAARIGPERGTNLRLGASTIADLGRAASVALTTHAIDRVPMSGIFEVTNRPVGEDIGIRLIYQADWHWTEHVGLTGRIGYNLRTIIHAGLSLGGGMVFSW